MVIQAGVTPVIHQLAQVEIVCPDDAVEFRKWLRCIGQAALDPFPLQRGLAASCQLFVQASFNGFVAGVLAPLLWGSTLTLALGMGVLVLLGAGAAWWHQHLTHERPLT